MSEEPIPSLPPRPVFPKAPPPFGKIASGTSVRGKDSNGPKTKDGSKPDRAKVLSRLIDKNLHRIMRQGRRILSQKTGEIMIVDPTAADIAAAMRRVEQTNKSKTPENPVEQGLRELQERAIAEEPPEPEA